MGFSVGAAVGLTVGAGLSGSKLPLFEMVSADTEPAKTRIAEMIIAMTTFSCVWRLVFRVFNCLETRSFENCRMSDDFIAARNL